MFKIRKQVRFELAHKLLTSWSQKCQNVHGHSYVMEVMLEADTLNEDGMVIDFGQLKQTIADLVEQIDHAFIVCDKDECFQHDLPGLIRVTYNPTAENMAFDFTAFLWRKLEGNAILNAISVRLHETATGWAEYYMTREEFDKRTKGITENE